MDTPRPDTLNRRDAIRLGAGAVTSIAAGLTGAQAAT